MANTIRIGTFEVSSFKVGLKDPKIYLGDILLYPTGGYKVCYAVVNDITQYSETEFDDVFDKATEKWFKLNNLNQYEQYGIYGSGRTSCEGSSRLPQGYTEVEYVENTSTAYIDTGAYLNTSNFEVGYTFWGNRAQWGYVHQNVGNGAWVTTTNDYAFMGRFDSSYRVAIGSYLTSDENTIVYTQSGVTVNGTSISKNLNLSGTDNLNASTLLFFAWYDFYRAGVEHSFNSKVKSFYLKNNGILVRDFVPAKRDSDNKYGMYDIVNDTFYLSPNNVDFSGGEPITPTDCVTTYNGKLTIDNGYEYEWNGSSWVNLGEVTGSTASLPDVPFTVNYNARQYNASTKTLLKTEGQLADVDAVITAGTPTVHNGYLTIEGETRATISGYQNYFNRDNNNPSLTIISKQRTDGSNCHMFANRDSDYNWMYRCYSNMLTLHGMSEQGSVSVTTQPVIESVRVNSSRLATYNNYTDNTSSTTAWFNYGGTNSGDFALFAGYASFSFSGEWFIGDFYWVYMCQGTLTDEQVQQVIDYNEEGGRQYEYPKYYAEKSEPLDNLTFNTMAEAQAYAEANCVYDGMKATIDGDKYYFDSTDENGWVEETSYTIWLDPSGTNALFNIGHYWGENYKMVFTTYLSGSYSGDFGSFWQVNGHSPIELSFYSNGFYYDMHNPTSTTAPNVNTGDYNFRILNQNTFIRYQNSQVMNITLTYGSFKAELADSGTLIYSSGNTKTGYSWYSGLYQANIGLNNANAKCHLSHIQVYNANNELVNDFKFIKNNGVVGSQEISIYDSVTNTTYNNTNSNTPVYHIET